MSNALVRVTLVYRSASPAAIEVHGGQIRAHDHRNWHPDGGNGGVEEVLHAGAVIA